MTTIVSVVGTIGTPPKLTKAPSQAPFCTFRLASTPRRYDREAGAWVDGETSWYSVAAFRGLAEHAQASFSLGDRVIVSGRLRVRPWKTEDRSGTNVEIEADALGHDLRWGTTRFQAAAPSAAAVPVERAHAAPAAPQQSSASDASAQEPPGFSAPQAGTPPEGFGHTPATGDESANRAESAERTEDGTEDAARAAA